MNTLLITKENFITTVTLNRPDVHNAFNEDLMKDLFQAFQELDQDAQTRVIILTGAGKSFCAGGDLNYMKSAAKKNHEQNVAESLFMADMFKKMNRVSKPVIGLVNGAAFGGGVGLVSVCDIALAHDKSIFCLSEVKLGLAPSVISPFVISRIGTNHARRYFLSGERFGAVEAKRIGLVSDVYTDENKETILKSLITQFLSNGPKAVTAIKELIQKNQELNPDELTSFAAKQIATLRASSEAQEGIGAFFEKRPAEYIVKI